MSVMTDLFPCSFRGVALTQTPCIPMLDESIQTSLNITYILSHSSIDRPCLSLYKCRQHLYFKIARWFLSTSSSSHYFYSSTLSIEISEMSLLFDSSPKSISGGGFLSFLAPPLPRSLTVATTFLFPVFGLKWFCVDNFLTLMFWFLESKSYPPSLQSAILSVSSHLPLLYTHASLSSVSWIHSKEACRWMASLISSYRYFWISVAVERVVNDFVNVTAACAQLHNRLLHFDLDTVLVASAPVQNEI